MVTVTTKIDPAVTEFPYTRPLVERASEWLEPILRESPEPVSAEWSAFADTASGSPVVFLELLGGRPSFRVRRAFTQAELASPNRFEFRARGLFSEFLGKHTKWYLSQLTAAGAATDED